MSKGTPIHADEFNPEDQEQITLKRHGRKGIVLLLGPLFAAEQSQRNRPTVDFLK